MAAGGEVPCAVQEAQDFDTYTQTIDGVTTQTYASDGPLSYKWTATKGTFKNGSTTGRTATWIAPDDITATTTVVITCTIDDPPGARVTDPDTGSHDDAPTVRSATVIVKAPTVEFTGEQLVNQTLRACAGGVDDHAATDPNPLTHNDAQYRAHTRKIDLTVKLDGKALPNAKFSLRFEGNKGHDYGDGRAKKTAKLHKTSEAFDAAHPWKETLDMQADSAGKVSVWVLSSDVIGTPKLQAILKPVTAPKVPVKLGEIGCDFAAGLSIRRFGLVDYPDDEDTGWIFTTEDIFRKVGDTTPAKVYLKFQLDTETAIDTRYFNPDETPRRPLDDDGNWKIVNDHRLRVTIVQITRFDGESVSSSEFADYATLITGADAQAVSFVELTTSNDGSVQAMLKAGPRLQEAESIVVDAVDVSIYQQ